MTARTTDPEAAPAAVAAQAPCAHCGLPVGRRPARTAAGEACCCTGCAVVRDTLASVGYGATYDRLRTLAPPLRPASRPWSPEPLALAELDRPAYVSAATRPARDGLRQVDLFVDGVHCAACVWLVERLPFEVDGVAEARLDLARARVSLTFDPAAARLGDVARWLARFGYAVRPSRPEAGTASAGERSLLVRMGVAWALAGNLMLLAFALYSGLDAVGGGLATAARWASLALTIPAVGYGAAPFFRRAWASVGLAWRVRDLRRLHLDTPISLGIAVGAGQSAWAVLTGRGEVWFDSVAVLIAALLTARWLQLRSRRLAGEASDRLLALVPHVARRVAGGSVEVVDVADLAPGDTVEVVPGEVVPVDGVVTTGTSRLDRAALTGEARPEPVAPGDAVEAGTTNLSAPLRIRTTAVGEATRVGRLLAWVERGEVRRAPVVLWADRIGGVFVLAVLALAVLTAGLWLWLDPAEMPAHLTALLVVTCPCALGMATPLALAVAQGRAARAGIFVKSDQAVQRLTEVDTVVLDKTGTLTEGRMELAGTLGSEAALDLAAALEARATHPVAEALVRARGVGPEAVTAVEAVAGQGVQGVVGGSVVVVGRPGWVEARSAPLPARWRRALGAWAEAGHTPVAIAVDGAPAAVLGVGDRLRPEAVDLVRRLGAEGTRVMLLSGDDAATVAVVAAALGIADARGGVSPEAKRQAVAALQDDGCVVLMVGDGVNDAAALRQADVGAAVGGGTTASLVAADLFLTRHGLAPLLDALDGAGAAMRTVRRLLVVSLAYNVVGAAAAVAGLVSPLVAAAVMPVSSLAVVGLALLQPSFRRARPRS